MDLDEKSFNFSAIFSRLNLPVVVFFAGLFVLAVGAGFVIFRNEGKSYIEILSAEESNAAISKIVVDVGGAVKSPGVYKIDSGARVEDAVTAAGGLAEDANRTSVNLAAKVFDGQKIVVPVNGAGGPGQESGQSQVSGIATINLNTASAGELDQLPQIGPATAQKIIAGRPYSGPDDLIAKKAVSKSVWEKIKDRVSF